ncbi:tyrosine-type recombinase/integrase [Actinoplanes sp. NPDC051494]|uniref:tyrosine-type recombinase/integrase n=1 Tax=Actinoplanes sp. NPDC051494 TaxID=3363907 RepID=UPI0037B372D8
MASKPEVRGNAIRTTWLLGGNGPKQSVTFSDGDPAERMNLVLAAKALAEAKNHCITRDEMYAALAVTGEEEKPSRVPTLKEWLPIWREQRLEAGDVQATTVDSNILTLTVHALPMLGHLRLTDIDRDELKRWVSWLKRRPAWSGRKTRRQHLPLQGTSVRAYYTTLATCLAGAVPKWLASNPAAALPGGRRNYVGLPPNSDFDGMFLRAWECDLILSHCAPALRDVVFVALRTGMRLGELVALECRDVLFPREGGATVRVRRTIKQDGTIGAPKTPRSSRDITVNRETAAVLARLVRGRRPSARVFLTAKGMPWHPGSLRASHWLRAVGAARRCPDHMPPPPVKPKQGRMPQYHPDEVSTCRCPGVLQRRPRLHDLRHTHASGCLELGMSPKKVQLRLGHASYQTTMKIYAHVLDLGGADELDALERLLTEGGRRKVARVSGGNRRRGAGLVRRGHVRRRVSVRAGA